MQAVALSAIDEYITRRAHKVKVATALTARARRGGRGAGAPQGRMIRVPRTRRPASKLPALPTERTSRFATTCCSSRRWRDRARRCSDRTPTRICTSRPPHCGTRGTQPRTGWMATSGLRGRRAGRSWPSTVNGSARRRTHRFDFVIRVATGGEPGLDEIAGPTTCVEPPGRLSPGSGASESAAAGTSSARDLARWRRQPNDRTAWRRQPPPAARSRR